MEGFGDKNKYDDIMLELAERFLNEKGVEHVRELLLDNKLHIAKIYVLGAIDSQYKKGELFEEEAAQAYKSLGIDKEEASIIRQKSNKS